jgi:ribosomal protein S27AE
MQYNFHRFISYLQNLRKRNCIGCNERKGLFRDFPKFSCCTNHEANVCRSCISQNAATKLDSYRQQGWAACTCPLCEKRVPTKEFLRILPRDQAHNLKELVKEASPSTKENWRWCPGCNSGALYTSEFDMITCGKCDVKACFKHRMRWHEGLTCYQYDKSTMGRMAKANEDLIKMTTKACPFCGFYAEKGSGCNDVLCKYWTVIARSTLTLQPRSYWLTEMTGPCCRLWWKWSRAAS